MPQDEYLAWTQAQLDRCEQERQALQADGRGDEAAFMQIRANVYGIFGTVCKALQGDMGKVAQRLADIPFAWEKSLAEAKQHNDGNRAHIERIKLDTVAHIRRALEGNP